MDRRTGRRYDLSFPVMLLVPGNPRQGLPNGSTRDISARGVYIRVTENLIIGAKINFIVTLSAEKPEKKKVSVRIRGRVIRIDKRRDAEHESWGIAAVIEWHDIFRGELTRTKTTARD